MMRTNQNLMPALLDELMDWGRWNNVMNCECAHEMPKMNITESNADYRIEMCIRNVKSMKPSTIVKILERLYRTEKSILSGAVDAEFAFTRFLAETVIA